MLRRVAATRYVVPLREGGSLPAVMEADDGAAYVVKFRGAGQGPRALVAEVVVGSPVGSVLVGPVPVASVPVAPVPVASVPVASVPVPASVASPPFVGPQARASVERRANKLGAPRML